MDQAPESTRRKFYRFREASASIRNSFFDSEIRKVGDRVALASHNLKRQFGISEDSEGEGESELFSEHGDLTLREWLTKPERAVIEFQCRHIFRQIIEIVHSSHTQGLLLPNLCPSYLALSPFNHISLNQSTRSSYHGSLHRPMDAKHSSSSKMGVSFVESSEELQRSCTTDTFSQGTSTGKDRKQKSPINEEAVAETKWYTSPEELASSSITSASDIYRLGIILFELFCPFIATDDKVQTMSNLCNRVLPPQILQKHSIEASFCLWLTNPDPTTRPKMRELLQSSIVKSPTDQEEHQLTSEQIGNAIEEQGQLLEFLLTLQKTKQETFNKTENLILSICSEIGEARQNHIDTKAPKENPFLSIPRLKNNAKKIESAYYATRSKRSKSRLGLADPFLEGLSNYVAYSKLKVKADIKQEDLMNSSNLVCCIAFDRDGEFFATAGVNKKIKIFQCDNLMNEAKDIHYPVGEMRTTSKLSSICWNCYIKDRIASSNFEGAVQVWDATRNQVVAEMREHDKRVWSVDYSTTDPSMLVSGSDDYSVKLWNTNQRGVVGTIRAKANACTVQFSKESSRFVAFGSADHNTYHYDLRNIKAPLNTLVGHSKTVSYVKFLDSCNLVSSSTDNTIKQWGLPAPPVVERPVQTFTGHLNVKNFVGLSVSDGYVATGSETNEVYVYNKAFPMPALSFNFHDNEVGDATRFISSVCWRGRSTTLVAANSTGNIKILEMI